MPSSNEVKGSKQEKHWRAVWPRTLQRTDEDAGMTPGQQPLIRSHTWSAACVNAPNTVFRDVWYSHDVNTSTSIHAATK